ncbi:hypothetical protein HCUR_00365 [Holospora curviuscula]|uniref:Uncharacterized protein n=1 Tax=Holospora curviuscula TaxID=1082868 RepID=A0A2S5RA18_9PROT|nr:hypothetical protein HCUR_00365 [Holospora curviuscula]
MKALRRLDVRDKKTLNHPKVDPEKRSVLHKKHDELNRKVNERGIAHDMPKTHGDSVKEQHRYETQDWGEQGEQMCRTTVYRPFKGLYFRSHIT